MRDEVLEYEFQLTDIYGSATANGVLQQQKHIIALTCSSSVLNLFNTSEYCGGISATMSLGSIFCRASESKSAVTPPLLLLHRQDGYMTH